MKLQATKMSISPCSGRQRVVLETFADLVLAVARFAGLGSLVRRHLGLTPQAFCCRLLPQAY